MTHNSTDEYDVFISHASEDKDDFVRPLAEKLQIRGYRVWYDEFSLKLGDSLFDSINKGIANSRYGIVVLSHNFFAKNWTKEELDGLSAKQVTGKKFIVPIWHQISCKDIGQVYGYPILAGKFAISTSAGLDVVVSKIVEVIGPMGNLDEKAQNVKIVQIKEEKQDYINKILEKKVLEILKNLKFDEKIELLSKDIYDELSRLFEFKYQLDRNNFSIPKEKFVKVCDSLNLSYSVFNENFFNTQNIPPFVGISSDAREKIGKSIDTLPSVVTKQEAREREAKEKVNKLTLDEKIRELATKIPLNQELMKEFFTAKPVPYQSFQSICEYLDLDWKDILDIDFLIFMESCVYPLKLKHSNKIREDYYNLQILDVPYPIETNNIYIYVRFLRNLYANRYIDENAFLPIYNEEQDELNRLLLGQAEVREEEKVAGEEVVKQSSKLMIFGKPGSGKTTFLQNIAIQCNEGIFLADRIPIFIRLKDFAENFIQDSTTNNLLNYLIQKIKSSSNEHEENIKKLLKYGRALILLDGLDEINDKNHQSVVNHINTFTKDYSNNQFIITCRIGLQKYRFTNFTEVEIADFDQKQIEKFVENWFKYVRKMSDQETQDKVNQFIQEINRQENEPIKAIASTPILLVLICLFFEVRYQLPSNRAKLYEEAINILLEKLNQSKFIPEHRFYLVDLSLEQKKELLCKIASIQFEVNRYYFSKTEVLDHIIKYLEILNHNINRNELESNSKAVLESIEVHHGLLVERAKNIYSFSHLTLQEYFTGLAVVESLKQNNLTNIFNKISKNRWREVFLRASENLSNADELLQLMKREIDNSIALDAGLQKILNFINDKIGIFHESRKHGAIRALYLSPCWGLDPSMSFVKILDNDLYKFEANLLDSIEYALNLNERINRDPEFQSTIGEFHNFNNAFNNLLKVTLENDLQESLQQLEKRLPSRHIAHLSEFANWWRDNGIAWTNTLTRETANYNITYTFDTISRSLGENKKTIMNDYYNANILLINCITNGCRITDSVKQGIEKGLFQPK